MSSTGRTRAPEEAAQQVTQMSDPPPTRATRAAAFAAIYVLWGSTFLAIRYAIESVPPFFMMGARSLVAGTFLYAWSRLRSSVKPSAGQWGKAAVVGALLFLGGHGALAWGEKRVPSGTAALLMATIPLWTTVGDAAGRRPRRVNRRTVIGLFLGLCGVALLAEPGDTWGGEPPDPAGTGVLLLGSLSWSFGSLRSRRAELPGSAALAAGMALISGGGLLLLLSVLSGEEVSLTSVSFRSLLSMIYLVAFGSVIAFAAYVWLMRVTSPARVSTYAFVNPVVAVLVGWAAGGEPLSPRLLVATLVMVAAVAAVVSSPTAAEDPGGGRRGEGRHEPMALKTASVETKEAS